MYKGISLFSNSGIGDMGVEAAGVSILISNELLEERAKTYKLNHPHTNVLNKSVVDISEEEYLTMKETIYGDNLFLLVSTPPCQGVSQAGKRNKFDIRNQLIKETVKAIKIMKPKWCWIENVPTYKNATIPDTLEIVEDNNTYERINIMEFLKRELTKEGYDLNWKILDAKDYGIPQTRKRLIIIITNTGKEITFPTKTHGVMHQQYITVRNVIGDFPALLSGDSNESILYHKARNHPERQVKWMDGTPEGCTALDNQDIEYRPHMVDKETGEIRPIKGFKTTYRRMYWDKPAPTVTMANGNISSQNNVHPRDSRALTVRELMEIQTIPSTYRFLDGTNDKNMREMIGEAVPSLLAEVITKHIISLEES